MSPGKYTELFFLDEATSFSAGHRPCSLCRNKEYKTFKKQWLDANAEKYDLRNESIISIDKVIHLERKDSHGNKMLYCALIDTCIRINPKKHC